MSAFAGVIPWSASHLQSNAKGLLRRDLKPQASSQESPLTSLLTHKRESTGVPECMGHYSVMFSLPSSVRGQRPREVTQQVSSQKCHSSSSESRNQAGVEANSWCGKPSLEAGVREWDNRTGQRQSPLRPVNCCHPCNPPRTLIRHTAESALQRQKTGQPVWFCCFYFQFWK